MAERNYMTKKEKERIIKQIRRIIHEPILDLFNPKVYKEFCRQYAEAITPELKAVDEARRRSMEHMLSDKTIIRSCYA